MSDSKAFIFIDGHVHFYACHELDQLLDEAWRHFQDVARRHGAAEHFQAVLMCTESAGDEVFMALATAVGEPVGRWRVADTEEKNSLRLHRDDGAHLFVLAGRQLISSERLELSAYFVTETLADGAPLATLLEEVDDLGGLAVLPWAVGKWLGKRGRVIETCLRHPQVPLLVSDNGGRPWCWPWPRLFRLAEEQGIPVLAGSDPLPKASEYHQAGRTGFVLPGALQPECPAQDLKQRLLALDRTPPRYGKRETVYPFLRNQFYMNLGRTRSSIC